MPCSGRPVEQSPRKGNKSKNFVLLLSWHLRTLANWPSIYILRLLICFKLASLACYLYRSHTPEARAHTPR
eukprot:4531320-Amphidinium_carterae.1